jgi:hypothetical protein
LATARGRHRAAGAAAIVDHDLLAERLAHALGDRARQRIVAAAGRKRHHQRDRADRIGLRRGASDGAGDQRRGEQCGPQHVTRLSG